MAYGELQGKQEFLVWVSLQSMFLVLFQIDTMKMIPRVPIEHVRYVEKCYYRQTIKDHLVIVLVIYDRVVMHSKQIVD